MKILRFLSLFMLISFSFAFLAEKFPHTFSAVGPVVIFAGLAFLILAVGYLIFHYSRRIYRQWNDIH